MCATCEMLAGSLDVCMTCGEGQRECRTCGGSYCLCRDLMTPDAGGEPTRCFWCATGLGPGDA